MAQLHQFQSLRGFGVGWSFVLRPGRIPKVPFQSLRGFGVGWSRGPLKALLYLVFEVQMREPFKCSSFALGIRLLAPSQKT